MSAKKIYCVVVFDKESYNKISYVTKIEGKTAYWEKGKQAKTFSRATAQDIVFGLCMNLIPSAVIECYDFLLPGNEKEEEKGGEN